MRLSTGSPGRRPRARALPWLGLATTALAACTVPNFEGPQIQSPPQGFLLVNESYQQHRLLPERELLSHSAWVESVRDFSTIYVDGYAGVLGLEDAMDARDGMMRLTDDPEVTFGEVESLTVDGRRAFGWAERLQTPARGLVWVAYRAVIPYDTVTYTVEFYSGDPSFKREAPESLKAVISTFAVGEVTYNLPVIILVTGLSLFAAGFIRSKRQEQASRLRSINLVKVPKKKASAEGEAAKRPPPGSAQAPAAPPTRGPSTPPTA